MKKNNNFSHSYNQIKIIHNDYNEKNNYHSYNHNNIKKIVIIIRIQILFLLV